VIPFSSYCSKETEAPLHGKLTRRRLLELGAVAAATAFGVAASEGLREAQHVVSRQVVISVAQLPAAFDSFTIAHLSDFHYDPIHTAKPIGDAVHEVNRLQPDIVVLTGDFVTVPIFGSKHHAIANIETQSEPCAELLSQLRPTRGTFAVLGNHDENSRSSVVANSLQTRGIRVLRNQSVPLEIRGSRIWVAGVGDVLKDAADLSAAMYGIPRNESTILLAHEPDFADYAAEYPVSVQLSGHSHGGQIRLPHFGPAYLPELARKYPWGLRKVGDLSLYTNCGLGTLELPIRINCPPEVTLIQLRKAIA
jgi:uncharacterized protein